MKRILTLLFTLILIPFSTFAISRSDLQNNPERYVKVAEGQTDACYVDSYSINHSVMLPPTIQFEQKSMALIMLRMVFLNLLLPVSMITIETLNS